MSSEELTTLTGWDDTIAATDSVGVLSGTCETGVVDECEE